MRWVWYGSTCATWTYDGDGGWYNAQGTRGEDTVAADEMTVILVLQLASDVKRRSTATCRFTAGGDGRLQSPLELEAVLRLVESMTGISRGVFFFHKFSAMHITIRYEKSGGARGCPMSTTLSFTCILLYLSTSVRSVPCISDLRCDGQAGHVDRSLHIARPDALC